MTGEQQPTPATAAYNVSLFSNLLLRDIERKSPFYALLDREHNRRMEHDSEYRDRYLRAQEIAKAARELCGDFARDLRELMVRHGVFIDIGDDSPIGLRAVVPDATHTIEQRIDDTNLIRNLKLEGFLP